MISFGKLLSGWKQLDRQSRGGFQREKPPTLPAVVLEKVYYSAVVIWPVKLAEWTQHRRCAELSSDRGFTSHRAWWGMLQPMPLTCPLPPPSVHLLPQQQWIFKLIFSFLFPQNAREATRPKTWEASRRESLPMWMMRPCATLPPLSLHRPPSPPPAPRSGSQTLRAAPPTSRISHLTALLRSQLCPVSPPSTHLGLSNNASLLFILPFF